MRIPKIIHQVWIGPHPAPKKWMDTWPKKNPGWEYFFWDNEKIKSFEFINQNHIDFYIEQKRWPGAADVIRYEILYKFGGIMPGADSECLESVEELFLDEKYDCYTIYVNEQLRPGQVAPIYGCSPRNKLVKAIIDELANRKTMQNYFVWKETGNLLTKHIIEKTEYKRIKIFPSHYFIPEYSNGQKYQGKDKIYARHYWGSTKQNYNLANFIFIEKLGLKGTPYYWLNLDKVGIEPENLLKLNYQKKIEIHKEIAEPLKRANKFLKKNYGMELMIKDGYRPKELYNLIYQKDREKNGEDHAKKIFNIVNMPHSTGKSVDTVLARNGREIKMRDNKDGIEALFVNFYKNKDDKKSKSFQFLQDLLITVMQKNGFRIGKKGEYFHFNFRPKMIKTYEEIYTRGSD